MTTQWEEDKLTFFSTGEEVEVVDTVDAEFDCMGEVTEGVPEKVQEEADRIDGTTHVILIHHWQMDDKIYASYDIVREVSNDDG